MVYWSNDRSELGLWGGRGPCVMHHGARIVRTVPERRL